MADSDIIIDDTDILLRRLPPAHIDPESVAPRSGGGYRATSVRMRVRQGEEGLSVTLAKLTTPRQLLNLLMKQNKSPDGWRVCRVSVGDVKSLGLGVRADPIDDDPGHCLILGTPENPFTKNMASKLAELTWVLAADEIV